MLNFVPSGDQVAGLLRTYLPALFAVLTAYGATHDASLVTTAILVAGPLGLLVSGVWSLVANTRLAIIRRASKPKDANTPPPQILLPKQETALADKLPDNVTAAK
jgi:hypothetical protein